MTGNQKMELYNLTHKWKTRGLNKAELKRKQHLEDVAKQETQTLASRLQNWANKHDTQRINTDGFLTIPTVYVNTLP